MELLSADPLVLVAACVALGDLNALGRASTRLHANVLGTQSSAFSPFLTGKLARDVAEAGLGARETVRALTNLETARWECVAVNADTPCGRVYGAAAACGPSGARLHGLPSVRGRLRAGPVCSGDAANTQAHTSRPHQQDAGLSSSEVSRWNATAGGLLE